MGVEQIYIVLWIFVVRSTNIKMADDNGSKAILDLLDILYKGKAILVIRLLAHHGRSMGEDITPPRGVEYEAEKTDTIISHVFEMTPKINSHKSFSFSLHGMDVMAKNEIGSTTTFTNALTGERRVTCTSSNLLFLGPNTQQP